MDNIRGGYIKHDYRYIGNKLIEELIEDEIKGDTYKVKYLYDERGVIYGFEYNNNTYYYIRDILQTIIGIMNTNKEIVCEYEYDNWGNHKVLGSNRQENTNSSFIGNINSIRYKGYYYDEESSFNGIPKIRNKVTTIIDDGKPSFFYT